MTKPQTDYTAMMEKWRLERETALKTARAELIAALRALGVTEVIAEYEGYGDSGNVEDITLQPNEVTLNEALSRQLEDFAWSVAYNQHPGFENNEGGYGTLTWDISADSITLDHADRYVECSHSHGEGL
ncbi:DUF6878 family protein [Litoreibacter roseus]|uniref:DUF6878 domain-containing protein n=1 Tax=Litoreibacter roseus TaxID=2601869 RepID=A0A6N6JM59_9RHOB|nr:DUF6878 family protein [Litoreibacter roseus]GFE67224.1 hypothetical protein KIN_42980 [Litoreibacter roseus]